jgi:hypothetical protein
MSSRARIQLRSALSQLGAALAVLTVVGCTVGRAPAASSMCRPGVTLGSGCSSNEDCEDACFCTGVERCEAGVCVAGDDPCLDAHECTADACVEVTAKCVHDPVDSECSDGDPCTGTEVCDLAIGCRPGAELFCSDEDSCTLDSCVAGIGCMFTPDDLDQDGFAPLRCGGLDCYDDPSSGARVHPGAAEDCSNFIDDDCDGATDGADPDCPPAHDTCADPLELPGPGVYSHSTAGLAPDYQLGCRLGSGSDAVFAFVLDAPADVFVTVSGAGDFAVALRAEQGCTAGPELACASARDRGATLVRHAVPAGRYELIVQTAFPRAFDLELAVEPPTAAPLGDTCETAVLVSDVASVAESGLLENERSSCAISRLPYWTDAFYRFELREPATVTLDVTQVGGELGGELAVSVASVCGDYRTERECWSGEASVHQNVSLPAGTYFVSVATTARGGALQLGIGRTP